MASSKTSVITAVSATFALLLALILAYRIPQTLISVGEDTTAIKFDSTGQSEVCIALADALPESVFTAQHASYKASQLAYWSQQACEDKPTCVVRPTSTEQVAKAVTILKANFDNSKDSDSPLKFAVRSGGHSPESGFASINGNVLIDTSLINDVVVSKDRSETRIGTGARWIQVSETLDSQGLAVAGGRNSNVGVGGLVLGGGISFYSPQVGMVCDNIINYDIVLANGSVATVSETEHAELWRALKGGSGNFGIVTYVTARTFPGSKLWGGYLYWVVSQAPKLIRAFHDFTKPENFDKEAAGSILAFAYVQKIGIQVAASNVIYTRPDKWPQAWRGFKKIWWLWSSMRIRSLSDATRQLNAHAPPGLRQFQITTTIKSDHDTLVAFHNQYSRSIQGVNKVKGLTWSLVFQPLSAAVRNKGSPNVLGLGRDFDDSLVIVLICASWDNAVDDQTVYAAARALVAESEHFAEQHGTADRYRYLNYAASGQKPFDGYGEENKRFLQDVSRLIDPSGFWQRAKVGGFKLDLD